MESKSTPTPEELAKKEKARWDRIFKVYGITKEQYAELDEGSCPICLRDFDDDVKPVVDHDHISGHVRGILCRYCNHRRLGRNRDAAMLRRMADYLDRVSKGWIVPPKPKKKRRRR